VSWKAAVGSTAVDREGDGAELVLKRPAAGEVKANTRRNRHIPKLRWDWEVHGFFQSVRAAN
jgi:hypothetical protein